MKKRIGLIVFLVLIVLVLALLADPVRALRISAIFHGCDRKDVRNAQFEKEDAAGTTAVYRAVNTLLLDRLTGSGHQKWRVYRILFVYIPVWEGNG